MPVRASGIKPVTQSSYGHVATAKMGAAKGGVAKWPWILFFLLVANTLVLLVRIIISTGCNDTLQSQFDSIRFTILV